MIEIGDDVYVEYVSQLPCFYGTVLYKPQDTGDMWYLEEHFYNASRIVAINSNCSDLRRIIKVDKK
jgi:hypothetical protein